MKFSFAWAALAAGTLQFCLTASLFAQGTGASGSGGGVNVPVRPSGTNVAVLDISLVFENYPGFQQKMTELKTQVEEFEGYLKAEQGKLVKMREKLQDFTPGSPEFKKLEEEMARLNSDLQIKMAQQRREFLEKEARIYFDGYNEVYNVVSTLAMRNDIKLVLRFNSEAMKPNDRASVLQGVNRAVVYQKNLNITNLVITALGGTPGSKPAVTPNTEGIDSARRPVNTKQK